MHDTGGGELFGIKGAHSPEIFQLDLPIWIKYHGGDV